MTYLFGDCELDPGLHELRRKGSVSAIEPKVFDLLLYLVENRDRVVSKDELNQRIWKGRIVSDASLSTCIKLARRAIGDSGRRQAYIRTVRHRGFRFVGSVERRGIGFASLSLLIVSLFWGSLQNPATMACFAVLLGLSLASGSRQNVSRSKATAVWVGMGISALFSVTLSALWLERDSALVGLRDRAEELKTELADSRDGSGSSARIPRLRQNAEAMLRAVDSSTWR